MASLGESGWPYVQHRGGSKGFLKVIDDNTLAFADFRGNKQYISTGNLLTDNRVALIVSTIPDSCVSRFWAESKSSRGKKRRTGCPKVRDPEYKAVTERVYVIRIEAFDWNCQQHIIPRYTEEEIRDVLKPIERQMQELQKENEGLRKKLAETSAAGRRNCHEETRNTPKW